MYLSPYLLFKGQCEEAFKLYEQVLGGKIVAMFTHEGSPMAAQVPPERRKEILHARMDVGDNVLMGSDAPPEHYSQPQGFSISINVEDPEEAERIFHELSEGGTVTMPIQPTFWAVCFAMFVDRFGTHWMVNCEQPK